MASPGVFIAFEETADELAANVRSLGFDLDKLTAQKKLLVDHVVVDSSQIEENGEYDLDGLFIRLGYAIDSIGAKRVVLDTIETLFGGFSNQAILRAELRRLFRWLKDKGVTAIITAERGDGTLTRQGLEEYVSDCVILLDHRVNDQVSTRRLRVVKYRGTAHGTNEYPFLIDEDGFSVLPITSSGSRARRLRRTDLDRDRRASTRCSGAAASTAAAASSSAARPEPARAASPPTSPGSPARAASAASISRSRSRRARSSATWRSIGIDLRPWIKKGLLRFVAGRPTATGLEMHLALMHRQIRQFQPRMVDRRPDQQPRRRRDPARRDARC